VGQLHELPHPSGPQKPGVHVGWHEHLPPSVHVFPGGHVPQKLPHPSVPHSFPEQ
jgi:hypothetical protein